MLKVFKKRISLVHSQRDYDDQFSSVHDVLSPLSTAKLFDSPASNLVSPNLTGFKSFGSSRNHKTMQKLSNSAIDKGEQVLSDDLDNSFIKTNAEFRYHGKVFIFCRRSLYLFGENNKLRQFAVWLTESLILELSMLSIIIFNAILLGMIDYNGLRKHHGHDEIYTYLNPISAALFAIEAILKIIARGFAGATNSYLRSGWNWVDLFVTISQVLAFEESLHYFTILRIGRIIRFVRPFKFFKRIDDMLSIISTSLFLLLSTGGLLLFFMMIFSIVGLNLYSGLLDFRCRLTPLPINGVWAPDPDVMRICGSTYTCPADLTCGSTYVYSDQVTDRNDTYFREFNWGITNFDNIFKSLFTVFVIINGNWGNLLQMLSDATNNLLPLIYFFITFIVCQFFIVQLAVAVMLENYVKIKERENPKKLYLTSSQVGKAEDGDNQTDIMSDKSKPTWRERWRLFCQKYFPPVITPDDEYYQNPFCSYAYQLTMHAMFKYVTIVFIVLNLVVIIMDRIPIGNTEYQIIMTVNKVLTILYIVEVVFKIIAQSVHKYFQDNFNILEFIIAILSMIEISTNSGISAYSSLRGLRLLRFMKKEYSWDNFKILITVVFEGSVYIVDFSIILGIYMYAFAILGMKYFAGTFKFALDGSVDLVNGFTPRANFDSLPEAFTVVFQVIVGEDFLGVVLSAIRAVGWGAIAYFIILILAGKYLLIQLFLAIILGAFGQAREQTNYQHLASRFIISKILKRKKTKVFRSIFPEKSSGQSGAKALSSMIARHRAQIKEQAEIDLQDNWGKDFSKAQDKLEDESELQQPFSASGSQDLTKDSSRRPLVKRLTREIFSDTHAPKESAFSRARTLKVHPESLTVSPLVRKLTRRVRQSRRTWLLLKIQHIRESSLFIFHKDNKLRIYAEKLIQHQAWETLILACILASSILLLLDSPLDDPTTTGSLIYDKMDIIFTILFLVEMCLKIISFGFFFNYQNDQKAYIRSVWNILDCFVVMTSGLDILTGGDYSLKSLKSLRALRALRPLRVISRNEDLKIIVNALFRTIPSLKNLTIVAGLIMIMGATIGTGFFKGEFDYCVSADGSYDSYVDSSTVITKQDCLSAGGSWINAMSNYDNFLQAMLTYFKMIIGQGWIDALYSGVDSVGVDMQPKRWARPSLLIYFYLFLLIGNVLIRNLFVGVVIDNFRQMKEELSGILFLNEMQRDWTEMQIFMQRKKLKRAVPEPENCLRKICFKISQSQQFQNLMIFFVIVNTVILGLTFRGQSDTFSTVNQNLNTAFLCIFHLEAIIGIMGLGVFYFKEGWNKFDIVILLITDCVLILTLITASGDHFGTIPTVIRSLRLGKIVKFIRASRHFRVLVDTLYYLLPSLANIGALLILMMFIYAVLGINLFAGIKLQSHINDHANFQNLFGALNILIRSCLGQDWAYFMHELSNTNIPGCQNNQSFQDMQRDGIIGCGTFVAYPYFLSYIIMVTLILISLFLAIVVGGYVQSKKENEAIISPAQMEEFLEKWAEYDPTGSGLITPEQYAFFIHDMPHPFGLKDSGSVKYEYDLTAKKEKGRLISENGKIVLKRIQLLRDMHRFDIPVYSSRVHFSDACRVISYNAVLRAYKNDSRLSEHMEMLNIKGGSAGKLEERIEQSLAEKIRIKSEYVNKTLARGWLNHFSVLKKLHREVKAANEKGLQPIHVTNYYAGKYIHEFWKKWKEDKRLHELQLIERKGVDYEKTFEFQQRLANVKVAKMQTIKRGKNMRLFEKNSRRTMQSVNSMGGMKEPKVASGEPGTPREVSLVSEGSPRHDKSRNSFNSIGEEGSNQSIGKGHLEKLMEYRSNKKEKGFIKRRASIMSSFAPLKSPSNITGNDFWLQNVSPSEKFPVPVTIEIDKFMLNYLEQSPQSRTSHSMTSESESMTPSSEQSSSMSESSQDLDNEKSALKTKENKTARSRKSVENNTPTSEPSSPSSSDEHGKSPARPEKKSPREKVSPRKENEGGFEIYNDNKPQIGIVIEEVETKPKERPTLFEPGKGNFLEVIEEGHEEDATTRIEIDNSPRKYVTSQSKSGFPGKLQNFFQQKLETGIDSPFQPPEKGMNTLSIISLEGHDDPDKKDKQANESKKQSSFGSKVGLGASIGEGIEAKDKKN